MEGECQTTTANSCYISGAYKLPSLGWALTAQGALTAGDND